MKKIPTLFIRDNKTGLVTSEVNPLCLWVYKEKSVITRQKLDGTCVMVLDKFKVVKNKEYNK